MIDFAAMPPSAVHSVTLMRHPESRSPAVRSVGARVCREPNGTLAITYSIEGDIERLRVSPPRPPRIAHELWQHTCCECFVALKGLPGYHEFNFAPSGEWTAYAFAKYRDGAPLADEALNPRIALRTTPEKLELDAAVSLDRLSARYAHRGLEIALSAVIEDEQGMFSYWALRHPPGKPDFHHRDAFALKVENPEAGSGEPGAEEPDE
jgi:hypothetical protein